MTAKTLRFTLLITAIALILTPTACKRQMIPTTRVADTPQNRAIFNTVMAYRRAMEQRDVKALRGIISRKYFENAGTTDRGDDDYGYAKLIEKVLPKLKENVKAVYLRILVTRVKIDGHRASANYEFFYKFKYVEGGTGGCADRGGHHEAGELAALLSNTVDVWSIDCLGTEATEIAVSLVICEDDYEVGFRRLKRAEEEYESD